MSEPIVKAALLEDLGRAGDLTTDAIIEADQRAQAFFVARDQGVIAGLETALLAFTLLDPTIHLTIHQPSGSHVEAGTKIATVSGKARTILTGERTALNLLGRLSGIATLTARFVAAVASTNVKIVCTRKTTPGLRALEKEAVRVAGGQNHRFGLDDAVLIKDNHIALAGGIAEAVQRARNYVGHLVKIEVEVDTLEQLQTALSLKVDLILLDNMSVDQLRSAVTVTQGAAILEASGGMAIERVLLVAQTGINLISVGALTHSSRTLDIGLDINP